MPSRPSRRRPAVLTLLLLALPILLLLADTVATAAVTVHVRARHDGSASVFTLPDGSGRPLSAARSWDGIVGTPPLEVDASIEVEVIGDTGPVAGIEVELFSSLGGFSACTGGALADAPTDADGRAVFSGPLAGGGHTDPAAGERLLVRVPAHPDAVVLYDARWIASTSSGDLVEIDPGTGATIPLCPGVYPAGLTEIAWDPSTDTLWGHPPGLGFELVALDPSACATTGTTYPTGAALTGMEMIGDQLYGTGIDVQCGSATLVRVDPTTGTVTEIGPTGLGVPVAGLAWDAASQTLYGSTGCTGGAGSVLVTIDVDTGAGTVIANTGVNLGSIGLDPDGTLYGVGNNQDGGNLYTLDPTTGTATLVGPTGVGGFTGLTLVGDVGVDVQVHGPDLDGDLRVDLVDVGAFAAAFSAFAASGTADFAADFFLDGRINLQDIGEMSTGIGSSCVGARPALSTADGRLALRWLEPVDPLLPPARDTLLRADLLLDGPIARDGILAWAGHLRGQNARIVSVELPRGSVDVGQDGTQVVGTGGVARDRAGTLRLATLTLRVDGPGPVGVVVDGVEAATGDATRPAVVPATEDAPRILDGVPGEPVAVLAAPGGDPATPEPNPGLRNVPNPFNPRTEFRFTLAERGEVRLRIYDLAGRIVRELEPGVLAAGPHGVAWDGTDRRGRRVTSGVYHYRLLVDGRDQGPTRDMVLLR